MKLRKRPFPGQLTEEVIDRETENRRIARMAAIEGFVLLKNEGVLPIAKGCKLGLYGAGATKTVKGGTGSGDVNSRDSVNVFQGLLNAGYDITSKAWIDSYDEIYENAKTEWRETIQRGLSGANNGHDFFTVYSANPFMIPCGAMINVDEAQNDGADTAIFVLSRTAGENADRRDIAGDYYLRQEEKQLLNDLAKAYKDIVLVVNTGGLVDLSFVDEIPQITAIIQMVQGGQEGGNALADIISGDVTPSGKLADTWTQNYADFPNADYFGIKFDGAWQAEYRDDIYVGYRYFDTFEVPVKYCFGYGLSYTDFSITTKEIRAYQKTIAVDVEVKNIGTQYSGKEVVQVYVSCPQGERTKEFRRLCCFGKTDYLKPGECQSMTLTFSVDSLSSYSEKDAAWVLDGGKYGIWVGDSLGSAKIQGAIDLDESIIRTKCQNICPIQKEIDVLKPDVVRLLERENAWHKEAKNLPVVSIVGADIMTQTIDYTHPAIPEGDAAMDITMSLNEDQLIAVSSGDVMRGQGALGAAGQTVPGAAAETIHILENDPWNVASIVLADGPAGLRLKKNYQIYEGHAVMGSFLENIENGFFAEKREKIGEDRYQYCTAIPVGTMLAQSWNLPMIQFVGEMIGREMLEFEVTLWLAPGMNIHRNPLCGRNFEYYSEDPVLAGTVAAAMTKGVQSIPGCGTTIKHFACNNQEDNRMGSDSILSERALREIYLKGFEIAVKTAQPMSIMTSYNMINGVHAAVSYDLCTKVARNEWGFAGTIMTDWTTTTNSTKGDCSAAGCIKAGNDLVMPGNEADHISVRNALEDGSLSLEQLRWCARNTINICIQSNQYEDCKSYSEQFESLPSVMKAE